MGETVLQAAALVGSSVAVRTLDAELTRLASGDEPVLFVGERGSGRADVARELHLRSDRAVHPFLVAKMSPTHSWLDSVARAAQRGTLCLANVGTLGAWERAQVTALIERKIVRIVACVEEDDNAVFADAGSYAVVHVPSLTARGDDFAELVHHVFATARTRVPRARATTIHPSLIARLARRRWPGNLTELETAIEAMLRTSMGPELAEGDLDHVIWGDEPSSEKLDDVMWRHIQFVLTRTAGNKTHAARVLGVDPATLHRWIRRKQ